eukprot:3784641-Amphidinium_carterae.1
MWCNLKDSVLYPRFTPISPEILISDFVSNSSKCCHNQAWHSRSKWSRLQVEPRAPTAWQGPLCVCSTNRNRSEVKDRKFNSTNQTLSHGEKTADFNE